MSFRGRRAPRLPLTTMDPWRSRRVIGVISRYLGGIYHTHHNTIQFFGGMVHTYIRTRWGWGNSGVLPPNMHLGGWLPKITWPWWLSSPVPPFLAVSPPIPPLNNIKMYFWWNNYELFYHYKPIGASPVAIMMYLRGWYDTILVHTLHSLDWYIKKGGERSAGYG
jgi:hypothetical protein